MKFTRRDLFKTAGAAGAATAVGGAAVVGSGLAAEAVAGATQTTLDKTFLISKPDKRGWSRVVRGPGEPHVVRTGLGQKAKAGRAQRRTALLAFAQLSDVHIVDAQSPARLESGEGISSSAYRPQEVLTAHVAESMVRRINRVGAGPVSGAPLALAIQTGDNSDNSQYNEIRWNIDVLDGGEIRQDSGDLTTYEGVMDANPDYYDPYFWHPGKTPAGQAKDTPTKQHGFPTLPGLLDACRRPFQASGLSMPWYAVFGNHDQLVQGNFPQNTTVPRARRRGQEAHQPWPAHRHGRPGSSDAVACRDRRGALHHHRSPRRSRVHRGQPHHGRRLLHVRPGPDPVPGDGHRQRERRLGRVDRPVAVRVDPGAARRLRRQARHRLQPPHVLDDGQRHSPCRGRAAGPGSGTWSRSSSPTTTSSRGSTATRTTTRSARTSVGLGWLLGDQHRLPHRLAAAGTPHRGARQRRRHPVDLLHDDRPPGPAASRRPTSQ